jgi:DNA (cytosine-5)-methyltransferase 3A
MNILSLFDGMSSGQIALNRCGFKIKNYFASEIDKFAIKVTQSNFPKTIQLGNVLNFSALDLPKIDLLIGGSPCQSFSFGGKRNGMKTTTNIEIISLDQYLKLKKEGFEFEGQSYLFWEYMRVLSEVRIKNPNVYFLLENVKMCKKWEKVLSNAIGINGIHINSNLLSAQNRKRIYWTNIGTVKNNLFGEQKLIIEPPSDKGIFLKDILEKEVDEKYFLSEKMILWLQKHDLKRGLNQFNPIQKNSEKKAKCLTVSGLVSVNLSCDFVAVAFRGRKNEDSKIIQRPEFNGTNKTNSLTTVAKDNYLTDFVRIRKLTPIECERLQTVPDNYTNFVSNSQRYKMIGNGWTVDIICHILNYLKS